MKIEIVAIGDEVLKGSVVNGNAAFLSQELKKAGYLVDRHTVLPDNRPVMESALKEISDRSTIVITTGGLGPTIDDLTKSVLCKVFDSKLVFNDEIASDLKKRYSNLSSLEEQSTLPAKGSFFINKLGTAPGLVFTKDGKVIIALPGVPREMEMMFVNDVLPYIQKHYPLQKKFFLEEIHLGFIPENPVDAFLKTLPAGPVEFGIYPGYGILHVTFSVLANSADEAKKLIAPLKSKVEKEFSSHLFTSESGKIEGAIHHAFIERKKTLALAESCTGGAISAKLTAIPDCSLYFLGSIVSYSNDLKRDFLGVSSQILEKKGAVSKETVEEMVEGLLDRTSCDYAMAVSGIAGPSGGTPDKPVGTIYFAIAQRGQKIHAGKIMSRGRTRSLIIEYSANIALFSLWRFLVHQNPPMYQ